VSSGAPRMLHKRRCLPSEISTRLHREGVGPLTCMLCAAVSRALRMTIFLMPFDPVHMAHA